MSSPEPSPHLTRLSGSETTTADNFPVLTDDEPYWQHLPRAEIVADPSRPFGKGLELVRGQLAADVLDAATELLTTVEHSIGTVVGISHSPLTDYLAVELYGEQPTFDTRYISEWALEPVLHRGLADAGTLTELADLLERNTAEAIAKLRAFSDAGFGLADVDSGFYVVVSRRDWSADRHDGSEAAVPP
jgi:hypothetical protein